MTDHLALAKPVLEGTLEPRPLEVHYRECGDRGPDHVPNVPDSVCACPCHEAASFRLLEERDPWRATALNEGVFVTIVRSKGRRRCSQCDRRRVVVAIRVRAETGPAVCLWCAGLRVAGDQEETDA